MRGSLGRLTSSSSSNNSCFSRGAIAFSTFPGGGGGRGRGRGSTGPPNPQISAVTTPGKPNNDNDSGENDEFPSGLGHGRGKPFPSNPILPSFPSWMSGINPSVGRGRSNHEQQQQPPPPPPRDSSSQGSQSFQPKKPIFFRREDFSEQIEKTQLNDSGRNPEHGVLPSSISSGLPGAGRGKSMKFLVNDERANEENRHLRSPQGGQSGPRRGGYSNNESPQRSSPSPPRLSREDAVKKAVGILSRAGGGGSGGAMEESERGGRGFRGRGGRGRGGRGMVGRRGGRGGRGRGGFRDVDDDYASGLYLGDNADGERLANKVGAENMDQLTEAFEEMSSRVLPSPMDDAYLDAVHTNNLIEYEPEYLMGDFGTNPDIDDKPPISLRDALEKVKPFLMAYEGIKDQAEWEKVMKETMDKLPVMKELIDIYSGPDRVTSKQQIQELERVAKTLPENVPSSVKRYTDRAVLSLQSNPGWGWDKKCQFMDKLAWEVSQQYK